MERPDNDEYFMEMAFLVAKRSTCLRRRVGAVIVRDKHVISTGYNGSPKGTRHCEELGCIRQQLNVPSGTRHELCRGVHAEQNAITQAAYFGVHLNPMYHFVTYFRDITMYGIVPDLNEHLLIYAWGIGMFVVGAIIFHFNKKKLLLRI